MAYSQNSKLQRYKHYLKTLFQIYKPTCFFCHAKLNPDSFYPKLADSHLDDFLIHHKNGNHDDNRPCNLKFVHRSCHAEYNWKKRR